MKLFKKTVAGIAAAAAVFSVAAVTASADYQISGIKRDDGSFVMHIGGIPQELFEYSTFSFVLPLGDNVAGCKGIRRDGNGDAYLLDSDGNIYCHFFSTFPSNDSGERDIYIEFYEMEDQDKYYDEVVRYNYGSLSLCGISTDSNGETVCVYFNSKGEHVEEDYFEPVTFTGEIFGSSNNSDTSSEPAESEPTSEPTASEPASDPVSEPAASEPAASEPVSSDAANTQPNNPDTGVTGVAAVFGVAALAAGVVVAAQKKQ